MNLTLTVSGGKNVVTGESWLVESAKNFKVFFFSEKQVDPEASFSQWKWKNKLLSMQLCSRMENCQTASPAQYKLKY